MADINIHFDLRVTPRAFRWGLVGLLMSAMATELSSENVTLSTYYPAPSGVYTQMLTTQNTWLARDSGNVGVGTANPSSKLNVIGTAGSPAIWAVGTGGVPNEAIRAQASSTFLSGYDGTGTQRFAINNDAGPTLNFYGSDSGWFNYMSVDNSGQKTVSFNAVGGGNVGVKVAGRIQTGDASNQGGVWLSNANPGNMFVGQNGTNVGFWTGTAHWNAFQVDQGGDIYNGGQIASLYGGCTQANLSVTTYAAGGTGGSQAICAGGQYATTMAGVLAAYINIGPESPDVTSGGVGTRPNDPNATFFCCPCPANNTCANMP